MSLKKFHTYLIWPILLAIFTVLPQFLAAQVIPTDSMGIVDDTLILSGKGAIKGIDPLPDTTEVPNIVGGKGAIKGNQGSEENANVGPIATEETATGIDKKHKNRKLVYDPKIAVRRSLILPGLGQLYNDRWWKVPIIYGGFAVFGAFIYQNNRDYNYYDDIVKCKADTNAINCDPFPGYDIATIISFREFHRRYRDLNVIFCALWYTLNAVDAYVDAHLKGFNVSDDLSLHINPNIGFDPFQSKRMFIGGSISLRLR